MRRRLQLCERETMAPEGTESARSALRYARDIVGTLTLSWAPLLLAGPDPQNHYGFLFSDFAFALGPDATEHDGCPEGFAVGPNQVWMQSAEGVRLPDESDDDYVRRGLIAGIQEKSPNGLPACFDPEGMGPDPHYRVLKVANTLADGIDLDAAGETGGQCTHDDFLDSTGAAVVDNQFYRAVGCTSDFQSTGQSNTFAIGMFAGEWSILLDLSGVDDWVNDDALTARIAAGADPIALSANREALSWATYALDQNHEFRAETTGRIVDGVLITDPVDMQFHFVVNSLRMKRVIQLGRIEAQVAADGSSLSGFLAGYTPVDAMYDAHMGYRNAVDGNGDLANARLRLVSAAGAARVKGRSCNGVYHAMREMADAGYDPEVGRCTTISTQYRFAAVPAFIVDVESRSLNDALDGDLSTGRYNAITQGEQ